MLAWASEANVEMKESSHGFVRIEAENSIFYRYSAVFSAVDDAKLLFKEDSLVLSDKNETKYAKGWLNISSATADVSFIQQTPIDMRTLLVESEGGQAMRWNISQVAGSDGTLEFFIQKGGQIKLDFLWQVPQEFQSGRVRIGEFPEVILPAEGIK
jgi:hypothetical protein